MATRPPGDRARRWQPATASDARTRRSLPAGLIATASLRRSNAISRPSVGLDRHLPARPQIHAEVKMSAKHRQRRAPGLERLRPGVDRPWLVERERTVDELESAAVPSGVNRYPDSRDQPLLREPRPAEDEGVERAPTASPPSIRSGNQRANSSGSVHARNTRSGGALRRRTIRTMRRTSAPGGKRGFSSLIVRPLANLLMPNQRAGQRRRQLEAYPATRSAEATGG